MNTRNIAGRKCNLDFSEQRQFFQDYHIQGSPTLVLKYFNLVYAGDIVASMTASHHHRQKF